MRMAAAKVASGGFPGASGAFCGLRRGAPKLFDESFEAWDQYWCVSIGLVHGREAFARACCRVCLRGSSCGKTYWYPE